MKTTILIPLLFASACATTSGAGKGSSAPFQGEAAVTKRRTEVADAGKVAMECMKSKDAAGSKGGVFAVTADASGKLNVQPIVWNGPDTVKQCIVDAGNKATVTPLPGPSVGSLWEFAAPGEKSDPAQQPDGFKVQMQPVTDSLTKEVTACEQRYLGQDFPATIEVSYFVDGAGKAYAPTVVADDSKDGSFDACVQEAVMNTKFPATSAPKPFPSSSRFKVGVYGDTQRTQ